MTIQDQIAEKLEGGRVDDSLFMGASDESLIEEPCKEFCTADLDKPTSIVKPGVLSTPIVQVLLLHQVFKAQEESRT
jgi:hypothetical protein